MPDVFETDSGCGARTSVGVVKERAYTDLDYWEDQQTVRDMTRSIESSERFLRTVQNGIHSDRYVLSEAQRRLDAHPEFADDDG